MAETVYHVCEAKFMSESTPTVGRQTFLRIFEADQPLRFVRYSGIRKIRESWETRGAPRTPREIINAIPPLIETSESAKLADDMAEGKQT